ncbi:hypothetical protein EON81_09845 [bacterium]|nr:MAG: hypothetical protein EON81_09845 [bacterium]
MGGFIIFASVIGILWCVGRIWASAHNESWLLGLAVLFMPPVLIGYALIRFPKDYRRFGGNPWMVLIGLPVWIAGVFVGLTMLVPATN